MHLRSRAIELLRIREELPGSASLHATALASCYAATSAYDYLSAPNSDSIATCAFPVSVLVCSSTDLLSDLATRWMQLSTSSLSGCDETSDDKTNASHGTTIPTVSTTATRPPNLGNARLSPHGSPYDSRPDSRLQIPRPPASPQMSASWLPTRNQTQRRECLVTLARNNPQHPRRTGHYQQGTRPGVEHYIGSQGGSYEKSVGQDCPAESEEGPSSS